MFWLAEDDSTVTQGAASRNVEGGLDLYVRLRGLQPGAHAKSDGCRVSRAVSPSRGVSGGRCKGQLGHARARKPARNKLTTNKWSSWKRKFARSTQFFSSLLAHQSIKETEKHYAAWTPPRQDRREEAVRGT